MTVILSQQQLYDLYKLTVQDKEPALTDFSDGAINDILAGVTSHMVSEAQKVMIDEFKKTFLDSADGPEVTGGPDDLQTLAVDHFGDAFTRPAAQSAVGIAKFTRPTAGAGVVTIPAGTVVKTPTDANGESQRFETILEVEMAASGPTALEINASVQAIEAGTRGNVDAGTITVIESTLTDGTVVVTNDDETSGGAAAQDDATYRETIRDLIAALTGATKRAIEARVRGIPGIVFATAIEKEQVVRQWNQTTQLPEGPVFTIPRVTLYIADANGAANQALLDSVEDEVDQVRACGVRVDIDAAIPLLLSWDASITLNPSGPNFATLSVDPQQIIDSMENYIRDLPIGSDFLRGDAETAILAIWGPTGSDDLTAIDTNIPTGDVDADDNEKLLPDTVSIS